MSFRNWPRPARIIAGAAAGAVIAEVLSPAATGAVVGAVLADGMGELPHHEHQAPPEPPRASADDGLTWSPDELADPHHEHEAHDYDYSR
jgi:hypothetical protein